MEGVVAAIRIFAERWDSWLRIPYLPDVGGQLAVVEATESRLGPRLPASLREWVAFAQDFAALSTDSLGRGVLAYDYVMEDRTELAAVIFLTWKGHGQFWAIHHSDFNIEDPPVHRYDDLGSNTLIPDQKGPVSPALATFVLAQELNCLEGRDGGGINVQQQEAMQIIRKAPELFPHRFELGSTEIFERNNVIAEVNHARSAPLLGEFLQETTRIRASKGTSGATRASVERRLLAMSILIPETELPQDLTSEQAVEAAYATDANGTRPNRPSYIMRFGKRATV